MALLAVSPVAFSRTDSPQERKPCGHQISNHRHGLADARHTTNLTKLRHYRDCARTPHKGKRIQKRIEAVKEAREAKEEAASLTPYPGPNGTHWAIPWYVVDCESGGDWGAVNGSSGARGPYQMLPSTYAGVCDTCDWSKRDQHLAAGRVWARSGGSEWVCA